MKGQESAVRRIEVFPLAISLSGENLELAFTTLHPSPRPIKAQHDRMVSYGERLPDAEGLNMNVIGACGACTVTGD
ncbi:MAG: hypothetical protein WEC75_03860, partial [Dehalococcoidia bacterium]